MGYFKLTPRYIYDSEVEAYTKPMNIPEPTEHSLPVLVTDSVKVEPVVIHEQVWAGGTTNYYNVDLLAENNDKVVSAVRITESTLRELHKKLEELIAVIDLERK